MSRSHRRWAVLAALLVLSVPATAAAGLSAPTSAQVAGSFTGTDGKTYDSAPLTVEGRKGELYYGVDFDVACGVGARVSRSMRELARLARVIEQSGRKVLWTTGPSKTTVLPRHLPAEPPHGRCDTRGFAAVRGAVAAQRDRNFLPLRSALVRERHQVYFKTDLHWTTVGGSVFAQQLARRLDPRVARQQRYTYGTESRVGGLNWLRSVDVAETAETAMPAGRARSRTAPDSVQQWAGYPALTSDYSWDTKPRGATIPGQTLLVGDSFTMYALDSMLPLFRHGRFVWYDVAPDDALLQALREADTVVLETSEVWAPLSSKLTAPSFRRVVRHALR